jgi:hypothetical protein
MATPRNEPYFLERFQALTPVTTRKQARGMALLLTVAPMMMYQLPTFTSRAANHLHLQRSPFLQHVHMQASALVCTILEILWARAHVCKFVTSQENE